MFSPVTPGSILTAKNAPSNDLPRNFINSNINKKNVVWGGASKGVIFSLLLQRQGIKVDRIIDISPDKQGRYIPGTGLRVMSPTEGLKDLPVGSEIHVMNPNYIEEVRSMVGTSFFCKGPNDD